MKINQFKKQVTFTIEQNDKIQNNFEKIVNYKNLNTFHNSVKSVFLFAQCFGLMPLVGVINSNPHYIKFRWESIQMLISIIFLFLGGLYTLSFLKELLPFGLNAKNMVGLFFFSCGLSTCILFISLGRKWPKLINEWTNIELIFLMKPYETPKTDLPIRIKFFSCFVFLMAFLEHGMYLVSATYSFNKYINICNNTTMTFTYESFMKNNFRHGFDVIPFSIFSSIVFLYINWSFTFMWNYLDLFIINTSLGIAIRFEQINMRIKKNEGKNVPESFWTDIKDHYIKLCELLDIIDENLSAIILLSCLNNLYFICYQFLNIFNKLRWTINYLYFWFSLLYLTVRTICLFLCAASINDQSKSSLKILRSVSSENWCIELERFASLMASQCVALSGSRFFFLTRKLLFGMAGTIVTYELVLLQFDEPSRKEGLSDLCSRKF